MKLLTNKTYKTNTNNWYAPCKELREKYKSIVDIAYMDMTSSAGDWSGFIVQKIGKQFIAIGFSQENNWQGDGFTLMTCEHPFYRTESVNYMANMKSCWLQFDN